MSIWSAIYGCVISYQRGDSSWCVTFCLEVDTQMWISAADVKRMLSPPADFPWVGVTPEIHRRQKLYPSICSHPHRRCLSATFQSLEDTEVVALNLLHIDLLVFSYILGDFFLFSKCLLFPLPGLFSIWRSSAYHIWSRPKAPLSMYPVSMDRDLWVLTAGHVFHCAVKTFDTFFFNFL